MSFREWIALEQSMDVSMSMNKLCDIWSTLISCWILALLSLEMTGSTASRFEFQGVDYHGMMERRIHVYRLRINIDILLPSCGIAFVMIRSATRYEFQGMYHIRMSNGCQYAIDKLRDIWSTKILCRILALLQVEMTWFTASRYEFQDIN